MGSGKSTLGNRIAGSLDVPYFDTDNVIESQAGKSISEIFEVFGEEHFRNLESDVLRQTSYYDKSINATGGGLPCFNGNMDWMKKEGITIYMQWPDELLINHIATIESDRPILQNLDAESKIARIEELLHSRKPVYEQAAITLEMKGELESDFKLLERACNYIW